MKTLNFIVTSLLTVIFFCSCNKLDEFIVENSMSDDEIVEGLKEALKIGTDSATSTLSVTNGYLEDKTVKILLPPEISNSVQIFKSKELTILGTTYTGETIYTTGIPVLGIQPMVSKERDLILGINRAAESAANHAKPIFLEAILNITISDAYNILFGDVDTAATAYLGKNTRITLFEEYEPKIDLALNSVTVGNTSVVGLYENYVNQYNTLLNKKIGFVTIGELSSVSPIITQDLSAYATNRGLDGLFKKVSDQEQKIRNNPFNRVTDILVRVFSQLDN